VIDVGERVPEARVWRSTAESVTLRELAGERPYLLLFYLFDWSST
jgi:peroxiredoxin